MSLGIGEVEAVDLRAGGTGSETENVVSDLERAVCDAPNPEFPVDADHIMELCPFGNGNAVIP